MVSALLTAALLSAGGCSTSTEHAGTSSTDPEGLIADLERRLPALMKDAQVPGLSIAIVRDGHTVWRKGFGVADSATGTRVDADTVFAVQSMSKPVFAYLVLKLSEKGILDLDAPLTT